MGHRIHSEGIHPSRSKTEDIQRAPAPTKMELQAFLGMLNFYSSFLKGKTEAAEPLYRLLDHDQEWRLTGEHQRAFGKLKNLLSSGHAPPNPSKNNIELKNAYNLLQSVLFYVRNINFDSVSNVQ